MMMFKRVPSKRASCLFQQSLHLSGHYCPPSAVEDRRDKSASQNGNLENQKQTNKHVRNITFYQMQNSCRRKHCFFNCLLYHLRFPLILSKHIVITMPPCFFSGFFSKEKMPRLSFLFAPHLCPEDVSSRRHLTFLATNLAHFFLQDILFSKLLLFVAYCMFSIQQTTPSPHATML